MNLEKLIHKTLNEMGGEAMSADRIKKEHVKPTYDKYLQDVLSKIPHKKVSMLGSAGKKKDSGDIDLGFETDLTIEDISDKLDELGVIHKVGKGFDQIWTQFDQYDGDGNIVKDEEGRPLKVQIDLMLGKTDWLDFAYWAPSQEETDYTAHHAKVLIAAIVRFAEEKLLDDGSLQTHAISWNSGVWTKRRIKYVETNKRSKYYGKEREKQERSEMPVITTPESLAGFLTSATGTTWRVSDLKNTFEHIWAKAVQTFKPNTLRQIAKYVQPGIEARNFSVPDVIKKLNTKDESLESAKNVIGLLRDEFSR